MNYWLLAAWLGASLNWLDAVLTMRAIEHGYGSESNPWLAVLIGFSIPLFYLVKGLIGMAFVALGYESHHPLARLGIVVGLGAYAGIAVYHLAGLLLA